MTGRVFLFIPSLKPLSSFLQLLIMKHATNLFLFTITTFLLTFGLLFPNAHAQIIFNDVIEHSLYGAHDLNQIPLRSDLQHFNENGDGFYSDEYFLPGFDGNILASAEHNGDIYIGGWFNFHNGNIPFNGVAKWNGSEWEPVGEGFLNISGTAQGTVFVLSSVNGELYAGGSFGFSGDNPVSGIAKWDGSQWQQVGGGVNGIVRDIIEFNGQIYIGGGFNESGNETVNNIARWDGDNWMPVERGFDHTVFALEIWDGQLVAAGSFVSEAAEEIDQNLFTGEYLIEQENPDGSLINFGSPEVFNGELESSITLHIDNLAPGNTRLFEAVVYGNLFPDNFRTIRLNFSVEENTVTLTDDIPAGVGCGNLSVIFSPDNDSENSGFDTSDDSSFQFAFTENPLEACDADAVQHSFTATRLNPAKQIVSSNSLQIFNGIAVYNGNNWSPLGQGFDGPVQALAEFDGELIAGGVFMSSGVINLNHIATWNGNEWESLGDGFNSGLNSLKVVDSSLFASGSFSESGPVNLNTIAEWDGNGWQPVGDHNNRFSTFHLNEVNNNLFAAIGSFNAGDLIEPALLENDSWNYLGDTDPAGAGVAGQIAGIAKTGSTIYASGNFNRAGLVPAMRTAKWTPQNGWQQMGSGLNDFTRRMIVFNGTPIAGGNFTSNGAGETMTHVAYYDGTEWAQLGDGLNGTIQRFLEYDDNLIIAGNFQASGPNEVTGVALWDGNEYQKIGNEIVNPGYGLAEMDGDLYLSGFNLMGNNEKIAVWSNGEWNEVPLDGFIENANNVWSLGVHDGNLYAAVEYFIDGNVENRILGLIDSEWEQLGDPVVGGPVFDMISHDDQLYVGGFFTHVGNEPMTSPIIWDDGEWVSAGGGINGVMHSFISTPRGLFIGGSYQMAGNTPSRSLAKWITDEEAVSTEPSVAELPQQVRLNQNYPNPFNPTTTISFDLPSASDVRIDIYDLLGRRVATLLNDHISAGSHEVRFDASSLSSGMYIYRLQSAEFTKSRSMLLVK